MNESPDLEPGGFGLSHYLEVVRRRKWLVVGVLLVVVGSAAAFSFLWPPTYRATTKIVVGQGTSLFPPGEASAAQPLTATMRDLVLSNVVASRVIDDLRLEDTPESLLERIAVAINPETTVLTVTVEDREGRRARRIAASIGEIFSALVEERFGGPVDPSSTEDPPLTARVWDPARLHPDPISPKPMRDIPVAFALGLMLGLLGAFLRDHFDRTLRTREGVEKGFGAPVIGQIPFEDAPGPGRVFLHGFAAEGFRGLRANLQYLSIKHPVKSILVTSALPEQGKTTVTANLAAAIARSGATVVAVDCDLRRPWLSEAFGIARPDQGVTSVLVGAADLEQVLMEVSLPVPDGVGGQSRGEVWLLPSGPLPPNPSELLSSLQMRTLLERLSTSFEYVLLDSPPLLSVSDALELAPTVDNVVLVVRQNAASTDAAREVRSLVDRLDIKLVGLVLTDVEPAFASYGAYGEPVANGRQPAVVVGAGRQQAD